MLILASRSLQTIFTGPCSSWFKDPEGRVIGLWPGIMRGWTLFARQGIDSILLFSGTCLHAIYTLAHPRWEDFEYKALDTTMGRFHWLGDGQTYNQKIGAGNRE
jgi:hypothetical protein